MESKLRQITEEEIDSLFEEINSSEDSRELFFGALDQMEEEQNEIYEFLCSEDEYNDDELDAVLYAAKTGWYIIRTLLNRNVHVSADFIDEQYARNYVDLEYEDVCCDEEDGCSEECCEDHDHECGCDCCEEEIDFSDFCKGNSQPDLMEFLIKNILDRAQDPEGEIREEMIYPMTVDVKSAIDCLVLDEETELRENTDEYFSDETLMDISSLINGWFSEFKETEAFENLEDMEQNQPEMIISDFSRFMYEDFLLRPENWNGRRAVEVIRSMPERCIYISSENIEGVEDTLILFCAFCCDRGWIPEGINIAKRLYGSTDDIFESED